MRIIPLHQRFNDEGYGVFYLHKANSSHDGSKISAHGESIVSGLFLLEIKSWFPITDAEPSADFQYIIVKWWGMFLPSENRGYYEISVQELAKCNETIPRLSAKWHVWHVT